MREHADKPVALGQSFKLICMIPPRLCVDAINRKWIWGKTITFLSISMSNHMRPGKGHEIEYENKNIVTKKHVLRDEINQIIEEK